MMPKSLPLIALVAACALPGQVAAKSGDVQVKILATLVAPDGKLKDVKLDAIGLPAGVQTKADDNVIPTIAIEYFVADHISIETIAGVTQHDVVGRGPLAGRLLASMAEGVCIPPAVSSSGWIIAGSEQPAGRDAVIAGGTPAQPWTLVDVAAADGIATVGRKIPHYGKYSYLLFEGGKNVAKGSWDVKSSPLRATFAGGAK